MGFVIFFNKMTESISLCSPFTPHSSFETTNPLLSGRPLTQGDRSHTRVSFVQTLNSLPRHGNLSLLVFLGTTQEGRLPL